jgi:hypothetical protein
VGSSGPFAAEALWLSPAECEGLAHRLLDGRVPHDRWRKALASARGALAGSAADVRVTSALFCAWYLNSLLALLPEALVLSDQRGGRRNSDADELGEWGHEADDEE